MSPTPKGDRTLRIIGGNWRSRRVSFPDVPGIRPTPDRVRETLFNWLQLDIAGSHCLELYAGSGILSMEALSRGAASVTIVDRDAAACQAIASNLAALNAAEDSYRCDTRDALTWLQSDLTQFDIIFIDPPFDSGEVDLLLPQLRKHVADHGWVYIETPAPIEQRTLPEAFILHRQKRAGDVHYALCKPR